MKMDPRVKHIFISWALHEDSFCHRGKPELGSFMSFYRETNLNGATQHFLANHNTSSEQRNQGFRWPRLSWFHCKN